LPITANISVKFIKKKRKNNIERPMCFESWLQKPENLIHLAKATSHLNSKQLTSMRVTSSRNKMSWMSPIKSLTGWIQKNPRKKKTNNETQVPRIPKTTKQKNGWSFTQTKSTL
jgi:hypothetical protein